MYVYENSANNFLLFRGINAYNSLTVLFPNKKVPCIIIAIRFKNCIGIMPVCLTV